MNTKKVVAGVALAGTIVAGSAGMAFAADGSAGTGTNDPSTQVTGHPRLRHAVRAAGKVVIDTVGGTPQELRDFLKGGGTVAGYAEAHGSTAQAVVDALVKAASARVDQAVANGRISAERGDKIKARLPELATKLVNRTWGQHAQA